MRACTVFFEYPGYPHQYQDMLAVLEQSCREHGVNLDVITETIPRASNIRHVGLHANTLKLRSWAEYIDFTCDDTILIDSDMMCNAYPAGAFEDDFGIAYTAKPCGGINGGVVLVKNTPAAKWWIKNLLTVNEQMYACPVFHKMWARKYPGMNQSAMGFMIERGSAGVSLKKLKTVDWNAVEPDWAHVTEQTAFIHIKGDLRRQILGTGKTVRCKEIRKRWWQYYEKAYNRDHDGQKRGYVYPGLNKSD